MKKTLDENQQKIGYCLVIAAIFIWVGFIGAISFMEAWLKFQAPGVSLEMGLGIGKLVFSALNKVEWFLAFVVLPISFGIKTIRKRAFILTLVMLILSLQTFYLLPYLNQRAEQIIAGDVVPTSFMHLYFIIAEFIKLFFLVLFGTRLTFDAFLRKTAGD